MVWTSDMDERKIGKCYTQKWRENDQEEEPDG